MRAKKLVLSLAVALAAAATSRAGVVITEVDPTGSVSTNGYSADWFELTNTGASAVDLTGWKMDDNSHSLALAISLAAYQASPPGSLSSSLRATPPEPPTPQSRPTSRHSGSA